MIYAGSVVGTSFEPAKSNIPKAIDHFRTFIAAEGDIEPIVTLVPNPKNQYDANAIEVHIGYRDKSFMVGHIPKTHNVEMLEKGIPFLRAEIDRFYFNDGADYPFGLAVKVDLLSEPTEA